MRIVVAGGTGFIGGAIVRRLVAEGRDTVVVTTRDASNRRARSAEAGDAAPADDRLQYVTAFAGDPLSLARAFARADVVIHAIQFPGHPVERPARGWTYLDVDGRGTAAAVEAARRAGVQRFVYLSGAGAGRGRSEAWFRAKDLAETAIRASGIPHVLLRPSWVYGPGDRSLSRLIALCRALPIVPVIGDGTTPVYPLHVDDLAHAAALAAQPDHIPSLALDLGGPERLTMDDVLREIQRHLRRLRPLLHVPPALMRLLAWPLRFLPEPPLSPGAVDFLTQRVELDPRPAQAHFGLSFRSLRQGLRGEEP
jgi:nucleoside-diphosphate-sugar epimerase